MAWSFFYAAFITGYDCYGEKKQTHLALFQQTQCMLEIKIKKEIVIFSNKTLNLIKTTSNARLNKGTILNRITLCARTNAAQFNFGNVENEPLASLKDNSNRPFYMFVYLASIHLESFKKVRKMCTEKMCLGFFEFTFQSEINSSRRNHRK